MLFFNQYLNISKKKKINFVVKSNRSVLAHTVHSLHVCVDMPLIAMIYLHYLMSS